MPNKAEARRGIQLKDKPTAPPAKDNLVHIDNKAKSRTPAKELNRKIAGIDTSLDDLRSELTQTNKSVKASLSRLSNNETDLTTKVSETYKQLGELEDSYQSLSGKSSKIQLEINEVSRNLTDLTDKSENDISTLAEGFEGLISSTNELARKSKLTSQALDRSIKNNATAMQELGTQLTAEINSLANTTQERDDELAESIKQHSARLLKLQAVDQALEKRAGSLEEASVDLKVKSRELAKSTRLLDKRTNDLSEAVIGLQKKAEEHSGLIGNLQERTISLSDALLDMATIGKRRFIGLSSVLALLVLVVAALFIAEKSSWKTEAATNTSMQDNIAVISNKLQTMNERVQDMDDNVLSLDGRMNDMAPLRQFGGDNTIHGPQWLANQPADNYMIHLATVNNKQDLYEIAVRYNHYLTEKLAFMPVDRNRLVLLYGTFINKETAASSLQQLPHRIERQVPSVQSMAEIQKYLPAS